MNFSLDWLSGPVAHKKHDEGDQAVPTGAPEARCWRLEGSEGSHI